MDKEIADTYTAILRLHNNQETTMPKIEKRIFTKIEEVLPPIAVAGQKIFARAYGLSKDVSVSATVKTVTLCREGRKRAWAWYYHVDLHLPDTTVSVVRSEDEIALDS